MLTLKNNVLTMDDIINTTPYNLIMSADIDADFFALVITSDNISHIYPFSKSGAGYRANLIIDSTMVDKLSGATINIVKAIGDYSEKSNTVNLNIDIAGIKKTVQADLNDKVFNLRLDIKSLEKKITDLTTGKVLKGLNISNLEYIQKGMVPVAIDNKGNFVAQYIFKDHVMSVNGIKPTDGEVVVSSNDVQYNDNKTVKEALDSSIETIVSIYELVNTLITNQKDIREKLDDLLIKFNQHINSGVV